MTQLILIFDITSGFFHLIKNTIYFYKNNSLENKKHYSIKVSVWGQNYFV